LKEKSKIILCCKVKTMSTISLTKLYDIFASKWGKEPAESLTTYIENKIKVELENKTQLLATKTDLTATKDILVKEISRLDGRISETHVKITETHVKISETHVRITEMHNKFTETDVKIAETHNKITETHVRIGETKVDLIKWVFAFWIATMLMILGLYFK
jgi:peptidoglycan hydrolase CwlO-like protein